MKCGYKIAWRWSDICFAFLICSILDFKIFGEVEGSVAQTTVESEVAWLNQKFSQPSLGLSVCPSCMLDRSMFMQRVGGRSLMYVRHA